MKHYQNSTFFHKVHHSIIQNDLKMKPLMNETQLLFICLFAFGFLILFLCCYKISNYIYILCHIDDYSSESSNSNGLFEMFGINSTLPLQQNDELTDL